MKSVKRLMSLKGRRAMVTGAAGHIGLAIGETLVELGATMAVVDRDRAACEKRARLLCRTRRGAAFALPCDLADEAETRAAVREAASKLGGLDILIHAAAYIGAPNVPGWVVPFAQQTVGAFDAAMRVNLTSAFVLAQEANKELSRSGRGSIILFSSIYGVTGPDLSIYEGTSMGNPIGYGASKGGLVQTMRSLSTVLAPRVRVNAISPGGVSRGQPKAFIDRYTKRTPLGRLAIEEDLKGAVAYLASDLSAYVTGQNLLVDGGWTAW